MERDLDLATDVGRNASTHCRGRFRVQTLQSAPADGAGGTVGGRKLKRNIILPEIDRYGKRIR